MPTNYSLADHATHLNIWKNRVEMMDLFMVPEEYKAHREKDTYLKFTAYLQEYVARMMSGENPRMPENNVARADLYNAFKDSPLPENWWEHAMNARKGASMERNPLANYKVTVPSHKDAINEAIMPMYRAVKEKFEKRWFFEFFTNHARYTAERDALKAMEGLLMATTGQTPAQIGEELRAHREAHPENPNTAKARLSMVERARTYIKNPEKVRKQDRAAIKKYNDTVKKKWPDSYENMKRSTPDYTDLDKLSEYQRSVESRGKEYYFKKDEKAADELVQNLAQDEGAEKQVGGDNSPEKTQLSISEEDLSRSAPPKEVKIEPVSSTISKAMANENAFYENINKLIDKHLPDPYNTENDMTRHFKREMKMSTKGLKRKLEEINKAFDTALSEGKDLKEQMKEAKESLTEFAEDLLDTFGYEENIPAHAQTLAKLLIANYTAASVYPEQFSEFTGEIASKNVGENQKEPVFGKENPFHEDSRDSRAEFLDDSSIGEPALDNSLDSSF